VSKAFTKEDDVVEQEIVRRPAPVISYLTRNGVERLRAELQELQRRRTTASVDLDVSRRIRELEQTLASAVVVETPPDADVVRFGAMVTVRSSSDNEESTYRIVGPAEADAAAGRISAGSPLAKALLNRKAGERVLFKFPAGEDTLEIVDVKYTDE
jgi:transcription elongation factor GreB